MSWAPFFHPSGQYLIFTTNLHGFDNFELYLADAAGGRDPVRVTDTPGFDGLPCFSPDGTALTWTSTRTADKTSQIFLGQWDHARACAALGLEPTRDAPAQASSRVAGLAAEIAPSDLEKHVKFLASDALEGRLPGTPGEMLATQYAADIFAGVGLAPAGDDGGFFQPFEFTAGVELGPQNRLVANDQSFTVSKDWSPLSFSTVGETAAAPVVFAGYGIELPAESAGTQGVLVVLPPRCERQVGDDVSIFAGRRGAEQRSKFLQPGSLRFKAMTARQHGAEGSSSSAARTRKCAANSCRSRSMPRSPGQGSPRFPSPTPLPNRSSAARGSP